jgi:aconitate hydratase
VVAFALAGTIDVDLTAEPVALAADGTRVYLKDIWPSEDEIHELTARHVKQEYYRSEYGKIFDGDQFWQELSISKSTTFAWDPESTYIKKPPYFDDFPLELTSPANVTDARALLLLGDTVTTDHISPAGAIPKDYPAGKYLIAHQVAAEDFNSYGSRRGNHEVMMRGTFANIRIKNKLVAPKEGSLTVKFPERTEMFVYDAAMTYSRQSIPLVVLGGKEYGTGSSRDWAAKGTTLLGIRAVIAESYERIHRSNLVGMGVLPLIFTAGQSWQSLGLDGSEAYSIERIDEMAARKVLQVQAAKADGRLVSFEVVARLDTDVEVDYFLNGGILPYVLRKVMAAE